MKPSILHIGALSILVISSLSIEAREPAKGARGSGAKLRNNINRIFEGTGIGVKGRVSEVNEKAQQKQMSEETGRILKNGVKAGGLTLGVKETVNPLTKEEVSRIVDVLSKNSKVGTKQQIADVLNSKYTELGVQLKKIAEKIEKDPESIRKEDLDIMLEFALNLKGSGEAPTNTENPVASNIMRDMANNMYDMASWDPASRQNALKLMKDCNANMKKGMNRVAALNDAFRTAERIVLPDQVKKRKKEIRENCRK